MNLLDYRPAIHRKFGGGKLLALLLLLVSGPLFAQSKSVSGIVKSSQGEPLVGVTVLIEGTTQGTSTDADGAFTLTATPAKGYVFLGWSGAGIETHGAEATFPAGGAPEITAHFVTQAVADSMEAVGVGGVDSSLEEALANGDVFTKEQIQEMAFGAPLFEVKDGEATIGLTLRTAEALDGDWEALKPSDVVVGADGTISIKVSVEGKTRFYKFVVPEK